MAFFVRILLLILTLACFHGCNAKEKEKDQVVVDVKLRADFWKGQSNDAKDSEKGKRQRRALSLYDRENIVATMNDLRREVGASNMPYMEYSVRAESEAESWTTSCDFDKTASFPLGVYAIKYITDSITIPRILRTAFARYTRELSSVYISRLGCHQRDCLETTTSNGSTYNNSALTLCLFEGSSEFNSTNVQYKRGKECTECDSGSFWCDNGLCRDNCEETFATCYCKADCLNCADTNGSTCSCECLQGWTGSRCETSDGPNVTTPICSTTASVTTSVTTSSRNSMTAAIGNLKTSAFQLAFCAVMALLLRL